MISSKEGATVSEHFMVHLRWKSRDSANVLSRTFRHFVLQEVHRVPRYDWRTFWLEGWNLRLVPLLFLSVFSCSVNRALNAFESNSASSSYFLGRVSVAISCLNCRSNLKELPPSSCPYSHAVIFVLSNNYVNQCNGSHDPYHV